MTPDAADTPDAIIDRLTQSLADARADRNRCQQAYQDSQRLVVRLRLDLAEAMKRQRDQSQEGRTP